VEEYKVPINGIEHTLQLDEHDAKRYGLTKPAKAEPVTKQAAPENKAATPKNKGK
jgi:hypothetical protein